MQSELQTVINNSLSSNIALTGISPQMQSTAATTDRSDGIAEGYKRMRGGTNAKEREGYSRPEFRPLNRSTRMGNQQRTMVAEQSKAAIKVKQIFSLCPCLKSNR